MIGRKLLVVAEVEKLIEATKEKGTIVEQGSHHELLAMRGAIAIFTPASSRDWPFRDGIVRFIYFTDHIPPACHGFSTSRHCNWAMFHKSLRSTS